ncbi:EAL domain-containing protein [Photobacterium aquimaris]|uniref:cyclic-guanylate-specific phosphodiesterase n=1 Tax=Photobacterium aquimaris TaxID=512643 RepID=A0A1Y6KTY5_9GAMM|nr:EAL domain-containing protein [Photobacterium aquimaris]SMY15561.1 Cyclic di-GMP phosphodiesterase YahA [Photobacterium aquimaris]
MTENIKKKSLILLTLLPTIFILKLFHAGFMASLEENTKQHAIAIVTQIDSILAYGEQSNQRALDLIAADNNCDQIYRNMRTSVTRIPYVRTTNLVHGDSIYCTSLWGPLTFNDNQAKYVNGELLLTSGSKVKKNQPLIVVRSEEGDNAALSGIDTRYIASLFFHSQTKSFLVSLAVGKLWLTNNNVLTYENPNKSLLDVQSVTSNNYPFTVYIGLNVKSSWLIFWEQEYFYILVILFAQMFFSLFCRTILCRPRSLYSELERAISNHEFVPYAQSIMNATTKELVGLEILMRWEHPVHGLVRPDMFIPQAERSGLIIPMTDLILKETAKQLRLYKHALPAPFHVGVNIAPQHCNSTVLSKECLRFISEVADNKIVLVLELTEREALEVSDFTHGLFQQLKSLGCKIAIDDFGTGHSSLVNLQKIDLNYLKIDQIFVKNIGIDNTSELLIDTIVEMAKRLSLGLIAEGVETEAQAEYLQKKGVDFLQGFLFSKPIPLEGFLQNQALNLEKQ